MNHVSFLIIGPNLSVYKPILLHNMVKNKCFFLVSVSSITVCAQETVRAQISTKMLYQLVNIFDIKCRLLAPFIHLQRFVFFNQPQFSKQLTPFINIRTKTYLGILKIGNDLLSGIHLIQKTLRRIIKSINNPSNTSS